MPSWYSLLFLAKRWILSKKNSMYFELFFFDEQPSIECEIWINFLSFFQFKFYRFSNQIILLKCVRNPVYTSHLLLAATNIFCAIQRRSRLQLYYCSGCWLTLNKFLRFWDIRINNTPKLITLQWFYRNKRRIQMATDCKRLSINWIKVFKMTQMLFIVQWQTYIGKLTKLLVPNR